MTSNSANRKFKDLEDYKRMTDYIIAHNYHNKFKKSTFIDRYNTSDSVLINFLEKKNISGIHIIGKIEVSEEHKTKYLPQHRDSIIEYHFGFVPIFGKRKELHFDFSASPPKESYKKNGVKQTILQKGIYYREY